MTAPAIIIGPDGLGPEDLSPRAARLLVRANHHPGARAVSYPDRLCAALGASAAGIAPLCALGDALAGEGAVLRFDPVSLRADMAGLVVLDGRAFALPEQESRALFETAATVTRASGLELVFGAPKRWYARAAALPAVTLTPLADAAGMRAHQVMPGGPEGAGLRALMNELQMALHAHPVNAAREARGVLPVNSIWPWGGGVAPPAPLPAGDIKVIVGNADDPLARGLAECLRVPFEEGEATFDAPPEGLVVALEHASPETVSMWIEMCRRIGFDLRLKGGRWRYRPHHALKFWRRKAGGPS